MKFDNPHVKNISEPLTPNTTTIKISEPSEWKCYLTGDMVLVPSKGNHPNWFHRQMQRLCFGFKWLKETK